MLGYLPIDEACHRFAQRCSTSPFSMGGDTDWTHMIKGRHRVYGKSLGYWLRPESDPEPLPVEEQDTLCF